MNPHSYAHLIFDKDAKKMISSTNIAGKTEYLHVENINLIHVFHPVQLKWISKRPETLKLMQERVGNTLELIGISNGFLNRTQMAQQVRERIDKWD
jgi:hypothetical protein